MLLRGARCAICKLKYGNLQWHHGFLVCADCLETFKETMAKEPFKAEPEENDVFKFIHNLEDKAGLEWEKTKKDIEKEWFKKENVKRRKKRRERTDV
jgi:hypothetical protein